MVRAVVVTHDSRHDGAGAALYCLLVIKKTNEFTSSVNDPNKRRVNATALKRMKSASLLFSMGLIAMPLINASIFASRITGISNVFTDLASDAFRESSMIACDCDEDCDEDECDDFSGDDSGTYAIVARIYCR